MKKIIYTALLAGTCLTEGQTLEMPKNAKQMEQAIVEAGKRLDADYAKFGVFDARVANDYAALSQAYYKAGNLDSAIEYALHALKVAMKLRKENDPLLAKRYYDAGNLYYMHKEHPTAMLYMQKAAGIYEKAGKGSEAALADTYEAIASIYINLGDLEKSKAYAQKTLALRKNILPKNDPAIKRTEENLKFLESEIAKKHN